MRHDHPRLLFAGEVRAIAASLALVSLLILAAAFSSIGAFFMKRIIVGAALTLAAAVVLSGCAPLTAFNSALVPQLKPVDAKIHTDVTCGDMAAQVLGVTAGQNQLTGPQAVAIVQFCERRDATQTLTLDPQGARKVLQGVLNKPAGISPGGLIAPAAAVAAP